MPPIKRVAIIGGGVAGLTAAWALTQQASESQPEFVLFEASARLGGIVETVLEQGFVIECGPDGWVTDKPWAHQLAIELGLGGQVIPSNDATRKTYIVRDGTLVAMPDGMRMMVPTDLAAVDASALFSDHARQAFHEEIFRAEALKAAAPDTDESVASFVERHFGTEVLETVGAPLLSGVFGGDVLTLSVRSVMAPFVAMEREHGSLITALQARTRTGCASIFTTLRSGLGALIDAMAATLPPAAIRLQLPVLSLARTAAGWTVRTAAGEETFDAILMAAPVDQAGELLRDIDPHAAELMRMEASSAVVVAFAFDDLHSIDLPQGFGFLVPPGSGDEDSLLAATFVDQKYEGRVPPGGRLIRAFFGGAAGARLLDAGDAEVIGRARTQLAALLGKLPEPLFAVVRRWPRSLPQYAVGHLERMAELQQRVDAIGQLWLLGNGYRGVGLPDLVRDARAAVAELLED